MASPRVDGKGEPRSDRAASREGTDAGLTGRVEVTGKEVGAFSEEEAARVDVMVKMIGELCPREKWGVEDVRKIVEEAFQAADGNYGEKEAQEWGADFEWPSDIRVRDEQMARECGFSVE